MLFIVPCLLPLLSAEGVLIFAYSRPATAPITSGLGSIWTQSGSSAQRTRDSVTRSALLTLVKVSLGPQ